jgi:hypothetical protein
VAIHEAVRAEEQVALPVSRDGAVLDLGRTLGDRDHVLDVPAPLDMPLALAAIAAGSQLLGQLPAQLAAGLHIQRAVDRLVADPHAPILRMLALQSGRDLLRRPAFRQPPLDRR